MEAVKAVWEGQAQTSAGCAGVLSVETSGQQTCGESKTTLGSGRFLGEVIELIDVPVNAEKDELQLSDVVEMLSIYAACLDISEAVFRLEQNA